MRYSDEINFSKLTFTAPGEYVYTIKELTPSNDRWQTDRSVYRVVVNVVPDAQGNLVASATYPDGLPRFINRYHFCPPPQPPCHACKHFSCLPFPMFWFAAPQKPEFMELMEKTPHLADNAWWERFFKGICNR